MAAAASYSAEMAIVKEATKGTVPAISGAQREYFTDDPSINPVQTVMRLPNITNRHVATHLLSDYHIEGRIPIIVTPEGVLGTLLACAVGSDTDALVSGTAYSHTFEPTDTLPTFSIWFKHGATMQRVINYGVINTLEFTQDLDDALRIDAAFIGQKDPINADDISTAVAYDTNDPFMNMDLTVTGPANATEVHRSNILINNNYDIGDGKVHGSRFYSTMVPGKREVTGSFDIWFDDDGDYQSFWGATDAVTPDVDGDYLKIPLVFNWNTNDNFSSTEDRELTITIPEAVYEATTITLGNRIKQTISWSANYDTSDTYELQVVLQNAKSDAY